MEKLKESIVVRGIAASLQAMKFPSITSLKELIAQAGFNNILK